MFLRTREFVSECARGTFELGTKPVPGDVISCQPHTAIIYADDDEGVSSKLEATANVRV